MAQGKAQAAPKPTAADDVDYDYVDTRTDAEVAAEKSAAAKSKKTAEPKPVSVKKLTK